MKKQQKLINPFVRVYPDIIGGNFVAINHQNSEKLLMNDVTGLNFFNSNNKKIPKSGFIKNRNDVTHRIYKNFILKYGWEDFYIKTNHNKEFAKKEILKHKISRAYDVNFSNYFDKLLKRRTVRNYEKFKIEKHDLESILSCGVLNYTHTGGRVDLFEFLHIYIYINNVVGFNQGIYKYDINTQKFAILKEGNFDRSLTKFISGQPYMRDASFNVLFLANADNAIGSGAFGYKNMIIEISRIAHTFIEHANYLGYGVFQTPAIVDVEVQKVLGNQMYTEDPFYILAIGKERKKHAAKK